MRWLFPLKLKNMGPTSDSDSYKNIDLENEVEIPSKQHCGAFGAVRRFDMHEGVDLYCPDGTPVYAVEDGTVVITRCFTGKFAHCDWWNETDSITIEGETGAVEYGEITILKSVGLRDEVKRGQLLGHVTRVLRKDKGRPTSMLHLQLYKGAQTRQEKWRVNEEKPEFLADPTPYLVESIVGDTNEFLADPTNHLMEAEGEE